MRNTETRLTPDWPLLELVRCTTRDRGWVRARTRMNDARSELDSGPGWWATNLETPIIFLTESGPQQGQRAPSMIRSLPLHQATNTCSVFTFAAAPIEHILSATCSAWGACPLTPSQKLGLGDRQGYGSSELKPSKEHRGRLHGAHR